MYNIPIDNDNFGTAASALEDHTTDLPVFSDGNVEETATITIQPSRNDDYPGARRPIPISTVDWQSTSWTQFTPERGVDLLSGVEQIYIQQTIELSDLMANVESENRYTVRVPRGESLFYASETSSGGQRACCGSNRAFVMKLFDQTQQLALEFRRRLACGMCNVWCYLQQMEVWTPDDYVGKIQQHFSLNMPKFSVLNKHGTIIYRIEGPQSLGCFGVGKEAHFKIYSPDGLTQLGSINHQWDQVDNAYNLCIQFPSRRDESAFKALLLGCSFLLEYMYFLK